jgi:hypothetical protein
MTQPTEFDPLISRYLDGSISAQELADLESRILTDSQFAIEFSRGCLLHRHISELLTENSLHKILDHFATGAPVPKAMLEHLSAAGQSAASHTAAEQISKRNQQHFADWARPRYLILAGALAIALGLIAFVATSPPATKQLSNTDDFSARVDTAPFIATVTQVVDVIWPPTATVLRTGDVLSKGRHVSLRSGLVKVTFECGAEVVVQGPCDFELQSSMVGFLHSGRITADVPRRAFSFAIHSPKVDFVDLGTTFGVSVGSTGDTELHVFEGEVLCSSSKQETDEPKELIHVTASRALEFGANGGAPSNIAMDRAQFSRLIDLRQRASGPSPRPNPDRLALWLTADRGVVTDAQKRVVLWQDILYGENRSAEDATQNDEQARPTLVSGAINSHPAVRFNGKTDFLLTTPLETTDDQTVLFVCQFSQSAYDKDRQWGGQILNYDGPPSRYLSNTLEPGVLQIGEPLLAEQFKPTLLTGQVFAGFAGSIPVESGRVDSVQIGANTPVVVTYVYDYKNGKASISINGRSYGETRAFAPQGITSRKIIGRHAWKQLFFHGDLSEMLIYNCAMPPKDLAQSVSYLAEKYGIAIQPETPVEVDE